MATKGDQEEPAKKKTAIRPTQAATQCNAMFYYFQNAGQLKDCLFLLFLA